MQIFSRFITILEKLVKTCVGLVRVIMYAYLKGILVAVDATRVVVDVQGVGYFLYIPTRILGALPPLGQSVQLFTSFVVRELSQTLYGFSSPQERDLFEVLMGVTGIGPKLALSLIGHLTFDELQTAVVRPNLPALCRVPGIGKKTAERLVVELKDKLNHQLFPQTHLSASSGHPQHMQDAMLALINLGYNQSSAQKALKKSLEDLPETTDLAELITVALKHI